MRTTVDGRWLFALLLGAATLATAGCFGGNRNFVAGGTASAGAEQPSASTRPDVGVRIGNLAPDFALKDLEGSTVRLSDLRGKPVLVNFWATWCPPCREEMPTLEKAYQKYRQEGVEFLGIDMREDAETVRKFVQQNRYSWTFLLDSDGRVASSYRAVSIPTSFFLDRDGIVRDMHLGAITPSLLEAKLDKIR